MHTCYPICLKASDPPPTASLSPPILVIISLYPKNIGLVAAPSEDIPMLSHSETRHLGITEVETMKALVIRKNQSAEQRTILESITPGMLESRIHSTAKTNP